MTTFQDGPAKGQTLMLHRVVRFLRVVQNIHSGAWDALDQPEDAPDKREIVFAYEVVGEVGHCHINRGGGRGGFYAIAEYKLCAKQPTESQMRDRAEWQEWVMKTAKERGLTA